MAFPSTTYPPIQPGVAAQFRVFCTYRGQLSIQTFYGGIFSQTGTPTPTGQAAALSVTAGVAWGPCITTGATFYGVGVKFLQNLVLPEVWSLPFYSGAGTGPGGAGTTPMDTQSCGLVASGTATPGKRGRGRTYFPFLDQALIDSATGFATAGYQAAMQNAVNLFGWNGVNFTIDQGGGNTVSYVPYLHKYGSGVANWFQITNSKVRTGIATQRRRGTTFGRLNQPPF